MKKKSIKVAIVGAGIFGSTIAIKLAKHGFSVNLFDPLGVMRASSSINQFRVHRGYHYPRSKETIKEILESRKSFILEYKDAISNDINHFYAIPKQNSKTKPAEFEALMEAMSLPYKSVRPEFLDYQFIDEAYKVQENLYNCDLLRSITEDRLEKYKISFNKALFTSDQEKNYDYVIKATYGLHDLTKCNFKHAKVQVAEKVVFEADKTLRNISLVLIDGLFTAFDPYLPSKNFIFGSARHTNHWETTEDNFIIPSKYISKINEPNFEPCSFTNFHLLKADALLAVPEIKSAKYLGSKFTIRVVENDPQSDRRVAEINRIDKKIFLIFSGKVVSSVKVADHLLHMLKSENV